MVSGRAIRRVESITGEGKKGSLEAAVASLGLGGVLGDIRSLLKIAWKRGRVLPSRAVAASCP